MIAFSTRALLIAKLPTLGAAAFFASSISVPTDIKSGYGALLGVEEMSGLAFRNKERAGAIARCSDGVAGLS